MQIQLVGLSHHTMPLALYEQIALAPDQLETALVQLSHNEIAEVAIVATCNRLEIYIVGEGRAAAETFLGDRCGLTPARLQAHLIIKTGLDAVRHLMRVSSGLESIILGEQQILGQVQTAIDCARGVGASGPVLSHLFAQAAHAGKRVRHETEISRHTTSISHAAVQLAQSQLGDMQKARALVVGGGEMATLAAQALSRYSVGSLICINRTFDRAQTLATQFEGEARAWDQLRQTLNEVDLVITTTSAPGTIIHPEDVYSPLVIVDIALPRDTDPAVNALADIHYYDMEHLKAFVAGNIARREAAISQVETIIDEEVVRFEAWQQGHEAAPVIAALREKAIEVAQDEVTEALRRLGELDENQQKTVERLAHRIVNKILHTPTTRLKTDAQYADAVQALFDLDVSER